MNFFIYFLILLYILIILYILVILVSKLVSDFFEKKRKEETNSLRFFLKKQLIEEKEVSREEGLKKWPFLPTLLVLEEFDKSFSGKIWEKIKSRLSENITLPKARKKAKSFFWIRRNFAARSFFLTPRQEDLFFLQLLLKDKSFFIRMIAVEAIARLGGLESIEMIVKEMAKVPFRSRFAFRHALLKMPLPMREHLLNLYQKEENDSIREAYLDILSYGYVANMRQVIQKDFSSPNVEIRLLIVRILENLHLSSDVLSFLDDPDEKVRIKAIETLAHLQSPEGFERLVSLLNDASYEVRLAAAFGLLQYGQEGKKVLERQDWDTSRPAYEIARYVLSLP